MLAFNELRIDEDKNLIIDASVLDITEDPNHEVHINSILVGVGSDSDTIEFYDQNFFTGVGCMGTILDGTFAVMRRFRLVIPETFFNTTIHTGSAYRNLIYVYVSVDTETVDVPCSVMREITGYTYDKCLIMENIFNYIKQPVDCGDITNYANYITQVTGLELAVEGDNFNLANKYWQKFFMHNNSLVSSNCHCNG